MLNQKFVCMQELYGKMYFCWKMCYMRLLYPIILWRYSLNVISIIFFTNIRISSSKLSRIVVEIHIFWCWRMGLSRKSNLYWCRLPKLPWNSMLPTNFLISKARYQVFMSYFQNLYVLLFLFHLLNYNVHKLGSTEWIIFRNLALFTAIFFCNILNDHFLSGLWYISLYQFNQKWKKWKNKMKNQINSWSLCKDNDIIFYVEENTFDRFGKICNMRLPDFRFGKTIIWPLIIKDLSLSLWGFIFLFWWLKGLEFNLLNFQMPSQRPILDKRIVEKIIPCKLLLRAEKRQFSKAAWMSYW